jgi:hypothetical protein
MKGGVMSRTQLFLSSKKRLIVGVVVGATALAFVVTAATAAGPPITTGQTLTITSRTVLSTRSADDNVFQVVALCGTASLGNGGAYNWCHDEQTTIFHPNGNWTFTADGSLTGSFPGCGDESTTYQLSGHGPTTIGGFPVGEFRGTSTGGSFHLTDSGELTPFVAGSTITYVC